MHLVDKTVNLNVEGHTSLIQKLVYSGIIDTLARCSAGPKYSSRERFTSFVKNFCDWDEHSKISLTHLVKFLELVRIPEFEKLRKFAYEKIDTWPDGAVIYIKDDPEYAEVLNLWPKDSQHKEPVEKLNLESLTHLNLLWKLRNSIVHEMRKPGYAVESLRILTPFYHQINDEDSQKETWELEYPPAFLNKLVCNGIQNLKKYCEENRLDPRKSFIFGTYWIEQLNL